VFSSVRGVQSHRWACEVCCTPIVSDDDSQMCAGSDIKAIRTIRSPIVWRDTETGRCATSRCCAEYEAFATDIPNHGFIS
jgi:hypothetical protein